MSNSGIQINLGTKISPEAFKEWLSGYCSGMAGREPTKDDLERILDKANSIEAAPANPFLPWFPQPQLPQIGEPVPISPTVPNSIPIIRIGPNTCGGPADKFSPGEPWTFTTWKTSCSSNPIFANKAEGEFIEISDVPGN